MSAPNAPHHPSHTPKEQDPYNRLGRFSGSMRGFRYAFARFALRVTQTRVNGVFEPPGASLACRTKPDSHDEALFVCRGDAFDVILGKRSHYQFTLSNSAARTLLGYLLRWWLFALWGGLRLRVWLWAMGKLYDAELARHEKEQAEKDNTQPPSCLTRETVNTEHVNAPSPVQRQGDNNASKALATHRFKAKEFKPKVWKA